MHLADSNLGTVFLHTGFNKSKFLRKVEEDEDGVETVTIEGREGKFVEGSSIYDKYLKRPPELFYMCFAQFAKCYTPVYKDVDEDAEDKEVNDDDHFEKEQDVSSGDEVLINSIESDFIIHPDLDKRRPLNQNIKLVGKFYRGEPKHMKLRKKRLAIRYHKFKRLDEVHEYCYSEMELYYVFEKPEVRTRCQEDFDYCYDLYQRNRDIIKHVKRKVMPYLNHVEQGIEQAEQIVEEPEIGDELDPEGQKENEDIEEEAAELRGTDGEVEFDYDRLSSNNMTAPMDRLFKRVEIMDMDQLLNSTRNLDDDQLFSLNYLVDYVKQHKKALLTNTPVPDPVFLKIFGSAGTGKSHLIRLVSQWVELIMRTEGDNPDVPYIIRTSFTGAAASAIDGQTLHSSFALNFSGASTSLDDKKRDKMRHILRNLRVVILDEFR